MSWTRLSHLRGSGLTPSQSTKTLSATRLLLAYGLWRSLLSHPLFLPYRPLQVQDYCCCSFSTTGTCTGKVMCSHGYVVDFSLPSSTLLSSSFLPWEMLLGELGSDTWEGSECCPSTEANQVNLRRHIIPFALDSRQFYLLGHKVQSHGLLQKAGAGTLLQPLTSPRQDDGIELINIIKISIS